MLEVSADQDAGQDYQRDLLIQNDYSVILPTEASGRTLPNHYQTPRRISQ